MHGFSRQIYKGPKNAVVNYVKSVNLDVFSTAPTINKQYTSVSSVFYI